jgi:hypothetical protein
MLEYWRFLLFGACLASLSPDHLPCIFDPFAFIWLWFSKTTDFSRGHTQKTSVNSAQGDFSFFDFRISSLR